MNKIEAIVEKLSQFNNIELTRKQWELVFKGCGCPKSERLYMAFRNENLVKRSYKMYALVDINIESFTKIWENYKKANNEAVSKHYHNKKKKKSLAIRKEEAQRKAREAKQRLSNISGFIIGGCLCETIPDMK